MINFNGSTQSMNRATVAALQNVAGGSVMARLLLDVAVAGNHVIWGVNGGVAATRRAHLLQTAADLRTAAIALDADATSFITHGAPPWDVTRSDHVAQVVNFSTATGAGYFNGALVSSAAYAAMTAGNTSNTAAVLIGCSISGTPIDGKVGEARIYDYAMTIDEINGIAICRGSDGRWNRIVGRWPCNENAPGVVVPAAGAMDWSNNNFDINGVFNAPVYNEYYTRRRRKVS